MSETEEVPRRAAVMIRLLRDTAAAGVKTLAVLLQS